MAKYIIRNTNSGVAIDLKTLYVYPDGHANLTFSDGTNLPLADQYEVMECIVGMLRDAEKQARRYSTKAS
jgi:hypothetical protein